MKNNAIIIAAGTSSRFVPLSYEKPKGLTEVKGEVLIERQLCQLREAGVDDICVVVGYMAEKFAYLCDKFGVELVFNEDYAEYNNISSLVRVCDRLDNTFICCSDHYYTGNPFAESLTDSAYSALFAKGETKEYCLCLDERDFINEVTVGGRDAWYMAGYAYFSSEFSFPFKRLLAEAYREEKNRQQYWEDVYINHINELPLMRAVKMQDDMLYEFDTLDELRLFDKTYIANARSVVIKKISEQLKCEEKELHAFRKSASAEGKVFLFKCRSNDYKYANGEIVLC